MTDTRDEERTGSEGNVSDAFFLIFVFCAKDAVNV